MSDLLELSGITKQFSGVTVLNSVNLAVKAGEVHSVVGENGAGKSTMMKIIAGAYQPTSGEIRLDGEIVSFPHPLQAQAAGIGIVYQELNLLPDRTVAENVFLGREPGRAWWVDNRRMESDTAELLDQLHIAGAISPKDRVGDLSVAAQQMVEIAKALSQNVKVLIFDEPTAALAPAEAATLFETINRLTSTGIGVLYVSHRLPEVFTLSDTVTVLKDGELVATHPVRELTSDSVVTLMVGRELTSYFPPRRDTSGDTTRGGTALPVALTVTGGGNADLSDINLELRRGEILGVAGLAGSGRTELVRAIFGDVPFTTGTVTVAGSPVSITHPRIAVELGMGCISEDRKGEGLLLHKGVTENGLLPARAMSPAELIERTGVTDQRERLAETLRRVELRAAVAEGETRHLSGGNQQKVVIAKWLLTEADILLFDEPTRGIDVGARSGIHDLIRELADAGAAVLMVSSDLPEVIGMSDRVIVMHDGSIAAELPADSTETDIISVATGNSSLIYDSEASIA